MRRPGRFVSSKKFLENQSWQGAAGEFHASKADAASLFRRYFVCFEISLCRLFVKRGGEKFRIPSIPDVQFKKQHPHAASRVLKFRLGKAVRFSRFGES